MVWGKKKKERQLNEELARVNAEIEQRKMGVNQVPFKSAINQNYPQREETQAQQFIPAPIEKPKDRARIIGCEVLNNENNLFRITLITNALLGNVGEEFDL